ncbi:unnamed protein product [Candida parapsilosis]
MYNGLNSIPQMEFITSILKNSSLWTVAVISSTSERNPTKVGQPLVKEDTFDCSMLCILFRKLISEQVILCID